MPVILKTREEEFIIKGNRPLYRILEDLQFSQQAYLVVRDGLLLTGDDRILEGDMVELISVVSGG
ncbi:MAG: MoaD/ThiS family protein [Anaerolineaceae bacterium]